jgi:hypothetical protein
MTLLVYVNEELVVDVDEDRVHIICCEVADDFTGVTTSFCGEKVFEWHPGTMSDDGHDDDENCRPCMSNLSGCPIGNICGYDSELWEPE